MQSKKHLAEGLALRAVAGPWTFEALKQRLERALPTAVKGFAGQLATVFYEIPQPYAPEAKQLAALFCDHPVFEQLVLHCRKTNTWPEPYLQSPAMHPIPAFADLQLPQLATAADLAEWLILPVDQLESYADPNGWREDHEEFWVNHYRTHLIPKKSGDLRVIEAPKPRLKAIQRQILRRILTKVPAHHASYGFVAGRNCIDGAAHHVGEALVVGFDLEDYFTNIHAGRVFGLFRSFGYPSTVARLLTGLTTTQTPARHHSKLPYAKRQILRQAHLPQGAPSSPMLANLLTHRLDSRLYGLAKAIGANYTRYADDLTFSGDHHLRRCLLSQVPEILKDEGFTMNPVKTRAMTQKDRQIVTGLVVNTKLNIARTVFDQLKAIIHAGNWRHDPSLHAQVLGQINWVCQVNPAKGDKLRRLMAG